MANEITNLDGVEEFKNQVESDLAPEVAAMWGRICGNIIGLGRPGQKIGRHINEGRPILTHFLVALVFINETFCRDGGITLFSHWLEMAPRQSEWVFPMILKRN